MGVKSLGLKADPYFILKTTMQLHVEKEYDEDDKHDDSTVCALYEFLRNVSEEELEDIWTAYIEKECVNPFTITGLREETEGLIKQLMQTEKFESLKFGYQIDGYDGLGMEI